MRTEQTMAYNSFDLDYLLPTESIEDETWISEFDIFDNQHTDRSAVQFPNRDRLVANF